MPAAVTQPVPGHGDPHVQMDPQLIPRLTAITEPRVSLAAHVAAYARLDPDAIQVRLKDQPARVVAAWARAFAEASPRARVIVNDRLDVARALGLGVHLGGSSVGVPEARRLLGEDAFVSVACHDDDDVRVARDAGATVAVCSPIFASPGKGAGVGLAALARWAQIAEKMPVIALGGIDPATARSALGAGAKGVAAIRAALDPDADWSAALR